MKRILAVMCIALATMIGTAGSAQAAPPSNDDVSGAVVVGSIPFATSVETGEATYAETDQCGEVASVWYRYTPSVDERVQISAIGSGFDTLVSVYTGDPSNLSLVNCSYQQMTTWLYSGQTYYLAAGTYSYEYPTPGQVGPGGTLQFAIDTTPPPITSVEVTVDRNATVDRNGVVTVSGTITCDQPADAYVSGNLTQRLGRSEARGSFYGYVRCGPEPTAWTGQGQSYTGLLFGPGNVSVTDGFAYGDDGYGDYAETWFASALHLRRR